MATPIVNAITVDVEDYFHVSAFEAYISQGQWDRLPSRVAQNTRRVLELFGRHGVKGTFFVLGWVAKRHPELVRQIVGERHELASHGFSHARVPTQTAEEFREDVVRTKLLLEDIASAPVRGYRAATFSIDERTLWALDILREAGYEYSSSVYPIHHDLYGMPDAPRFPFRHERSGLLEIPLSTLRLLKLNLPIGGGGYFRLVPYAVFRRALAKVNEREHQPCVFFCHPWELDPEQPRPNGVGFKSRFRHYLNLSRMEARLENLLGDLLWDRIDRVFASYLEPGYECRSITASSST